eukprot:2119349-Prorocentrum_lima.AAC.1
MMPTTRPHRAPRVRQNHIQLHRPKQQHYNNLKTTELETRKTNAYRTNHHDIAQQQKMQHTQQKTTTKTTPT